MKRGDLVKIGDLDYQCVFSFPHSKIQYVVTAYAGKTTTYRPLNKKYKGYYTVADSTKVRFIRDYEIFRGNRSFQ